MTTVPNSTPSLNCSAQALQLRESPGPARRAAGVCSSTSRRSEPPALCVAVHDGAGVALLEQVIGRGQAGRAGATMATDFLRRGLRRGSRAGLDWQSRYRPRTVPCREWRRVRPRSRGGNPARTDDGKAGPAPPAAARRSRTVTMASSSRPAWICRSITGMFRCKRAKPMAGREAIAHVIAEQQFQRGAPRFVDFVGLAFHDHAGLRLWCRRKARACR